MKLQACQTSITQDMCSAHQPCSFRRSTPKIASVSWKFGSVKREPLAEESQDEHSKHANELFLRTVSAGVQKNGLSSDVICVHARCARATEFLIV